MSKEQFVKNLKTDIRHTLLLGGKNEIPLTDNQYDLVYRHLRIYQTMTELAIQSAEQKHHGNMEMHDVLTDAWRKLNDQESEICDQLFNMGVYKSKYDTPWKSEGIFKDVEDCDGLSASVYQYHEHLVENW